MGNHSWNEIYISVEEAPLANKARMLSKQQSYEISWKFFYHIYHVIVWFTCTCICKHTYQITNTFTVIITFLTHIVIISMNTLFVKEINDKISMYFSLSLIL